jgi:glycosyltransferase involved in cell wall biosynthesis
VASATIGSSTTRRPDALAPADGDDLHVTLIAWMVAGVQTQYEHLRTALPSQALHATHLEVVPHRPAGWIERLPIPSSIKGTARSTRTVLTMFAAPRVDAVWSQVALPLLPFAVTRAAWERIPICYAIDCTPKLLFDFGSRYPNVTDPASSKGRLTAACLRLFFRRCAALLPWSEWAAHSMIQDYGVPADRVHVIAPGVDIQRWTPALGPSPARSRPQLLFVGGDFERKGGALLLDVYRTHLRHTVDLHLVTRAPVAPEPGVTVHRRFDPGSTGLLELYQRCDLLVVPTLADCFSMAAIEGMACGLPVVISAVGGIPEIVSDGISGSLVPPGDGLALLAAIDALLADPVRRRRFGRAGRAIATRRFDAAIQSARVADLIRTEVRRSAACT